MTCDFARSRFSALRDGALSGMDHHTVTAHLDACVACDASWRDYMKTLDALVALPRLECAGEVASRVFDRIDMENRKPGLAALFRPRGASRPLMIPSLAPATMVLVIVIGAIFAVDRPEPLPPIVTVQQKRIESWTTLPSPVPEWGTERNPLFAYGDVSSPRARATAVPSYLLEQRGEGTLFLETVVARDGTVSAVHLIGGNSADAAPLLEAMRKERYEPGRFRGRPVAVSMYRLISRMEVRAPIT